MVNLTLTTKEKAALKSWWHMPVRVKDGNVELKKGESWGILCSIEEGKKNAQMIIKKSK
jgi:hypothetical protein